MTARLYLAPDAYGDETIWRDTGDDRDEAVLTRHGGNAAGFDALAGLVAAACAADARWALSTPSLWESPDGRSVPTLLAAIGQVLADGATR